MVLVLDEAEAIHELDLRNLAGAMGVEVVLNIGLGSYNQKIRSAMPIPGFHAWPAPVLLKSGALHDLSQSKKRSAPAGHASYSIGGPVLTSARQVPQIEARVRDGRLLVRLRHLGGCGG